MMSKTNNTIKLKHTKEWFRQADYDLDTAKAMFKTGRYIYAVFMCHLSIEKALKGLYTQKTREIPPKTHNLLYLIEKLKLEIPEIFYDFLFNLNRVSVPTRYPSDLRKMLKDYDRNRTINILQKSMEVLQWLKVISKQQ